MNSLEETRPQRSGPDLAAFQPIPMSKGEKQKIRNKQFRRAFVFGVIAFILLYFFAPLRTNLLILGTDDSPSRGVLGRTDTIILTTVVPFKPYVGMLGIPRDLWVNIPNVGEQRINTAYFFAEAEKPGSGGQAAVTSVATNFGVQVHYYLAIHMMGLVDLVNILDGIDIVLEKPMGGLPAGENHLTGEALLVFVRERYSASDFSRMQQGQIVISALLKKLLSPTSWGKLPQLLMTLPNVIENNIPLWQYPRLGFALIRASLVGVDSRTIDWEMVTPFVTSGGAQVLAPNWDVINPVLLEMFGE